ncbi:LysR family transcriptional regulator [Caballeronia hypogeia]|uniref:LysR family transcriptional regulator n=1 Tax=Caballeronia hypogeia TaxID=1777140 RepID=A0A158DFP7_9BURK|nr:LysR substrate-binding domain-containing protein [Caballeronia hypogeia]SAK93395.1 LysR family transcriptional regulator [Caballeronia hypogeia]
MNDSKDSNDPLPSLNALRAFEAASRHLSFRRAAEALGVTEGAIGQHIRGLESELGVKLFERRPRALILTDNGQLYASTVRRAFDLLIDATRAIRPQSLKIAISVTPTFAAKWLIPRLPDFTNMHPGIDLRIVASDRLSHFQSDGVDIAVRYGSPPFGPGLAADLLFEDVLIAVAHPRLLADQARDHDRFPDKVALLHDAHSMWPQYLTRVTGRPGTLDRKNIRFNQTALAVDAAMEGQGIALAHPAFVSRDIAAGRLVRVGDAELLTGAGFYIVTPRKPVHREPVATLREWLHGQAASALSPVSS